MTLFLPEVVIEFSMEIDEAIDWVLRACQHQLIAATHNGMAYPTGEASDLGNKLLHSVQTSPVSSIIWFINTWPDARRWFSALEMASEGIPWDTGSSPPPCPGRAAAICWLWWSLVGLGHYTGGWSLTVPCRWLRKNRHFKQPLHLPLFSSLKFSEFITFILNFFFIEMKFTKWRLSHFKVYNYYTWVLLQSFQPSSSCKIFSSTLGTISCPLIVIPCPYAPAH